MNNYEKRKFLDYLDKLINHIDITSFDFKIVFTGMLDEFKIDKKNFLSGNESSLTIDTTKQQTEFIANLKKTIKLLKNKIKPRNTLLEKQLLMIKDVYSLANDEYEMMLYYVLKEINEIFYHLDASLLDGTVSPFVKYCLKLRHNQKERVRHSLYMKNIFLFEGEDCVNGKLIEILDNPKCNTQNKIVNTLIGKQEKSKLTLDNYKHLKNEPEKVIRILSSAVKKNTKGVNILLYGGVGTGKTEFAKLAANVANVPIYSVFTQKQNFEEPDRQDRMIDLFSKQHLLARTQKACILFDEAEDVMNRGFSFWGSASKGYLNTLLESSAVPTIWTTNNISDVDPAFLRRMTYCVEFEKLSKEMRLGIWNETIKKHKLKVNKEKVEELNKNYDIPPSIIANAVETTKMIDGNENDFENFVENLARVVTKRKNVKNKKEFEMNKYDLDLINTDTDINVLTQNIKHTKKLNFSMCLYGEPGTGKSLYARYLANTLGLEVVFKRASDLISKWVGETEQNIAAAFAEAETKKALLIFDEADTFLNDRNKAFNRWEVSQVNEMLTWMESHEYPFVCTTNLLDCLDEASLRRFTFKIKFDFLTKEQVNQSIEHFFGIKNTNVSINGLTAGDFATVKKKIDFWGTKDINEIVKMLNDEVKLKKSKNLKNTVGF